MTDVVERAPKDAAELIAHLDAHEPALVQLAGSLSIACQIEPRLLRRARRRFVSDADARVEAELWCSMLVGRRSAECVVLRGDVARALQARLVASGRLEDARSLVEEAHRHLAPALILEERLTYRALRGDDPKALEAELVSALKAIQVPGRQGLTSWAERALARAPRRVQELRAARALGGVVQGLRLAGGRPGKEPGLDWTRYVRPREGYVTLTATWRRGMLELLAESRSWSAIHDEGPTTWPDNRIVLRRSSPLAVEVAPMDGSQPARVIALEEGVTTRLPIGDEFLLRTRDGLRWAGRWLRMRVHVSFHEDDRAIAERLAETMHDTSGATVTLRALTDEAPWDAPEKVSEAHGMFVVWGRASTASRTQNWELKQAAEARKLDHEFPVIVVRSEPGVDYGGLESWVAPTALFDSDQESLVRSCDHMNPKVAHGTEPPRNANARRRVEAACARVWWSETESTWGVLIAPDVLATVGPAGHDPVRVEFARGSCGAWRAELGESPPSPLTTCVLRLDRTYDGSAPLGLEGRLQVIPLLGKFARPDFDALSWVRGRGFQRDMLPDPPFHPLRSRGAGTPIMYGLAVVGTLAAEVESTREPVFRGPTSTTITKQLGAADAPERGRQDHAIVIAFDTPSRGFLGIAGARRFLDWLRHPRWGNLPESNLHALLPSGEDLEAHDFLEVLRTIRDLPRPTDETPTPRPSASQTHGYGFAGRRLYVFLAGLETRTKAGRLDASLLVNPHARDRRGLDIRSFVSNLSGWFQELVVFSSLAGDSGEALADPLVLPGRLVAEGPRAVPDVFRGYLKVTARDEREPGGSFIAALSSPDSDGRVTLGSIAQYVSRASSVSVEREGDLTLLDEVAARPPLSSPSVPGTTSHKPRVFVSYSDRDGQVVADDLVAALKGAGYEPQRDRELLTPGTEWRQVMAQALGDCDAAVVVLSPTALESKWIEHEANVLSHRRATSSGFPLIPFLVGGAKLERAPASLPNLKAATSLEQVLDALRAAPHRESQSQGYPRTSAPQRTSSPLVFISCPRADADPAALVAAERMATTLASSGLEPRTELGEPTQALRAAVDDALARCHAAVVILSPATLRSPRLAHEASVLTHRRALIPTFPLFPLLAGGASINDLPADPPFAALRELHFVTSVEQVATAIDGALHGHGAIGEGAIGEHPL